LITKFGLSLDLVLFPVYLWA